MLVVSRTHGPGPFRLVDGPSDGVASFCSAACRIRAAVRCVILFPFWRGRRGRWGEEGFRRALMSTHHRGIPPDVPADLPGGIRRDLPAGAVVPKGRSPTTFGAAHEPSSTARVVPTGHASAPRPHPVQNPADHLPMIPPPPAPTIACRQERLQPLPLRVRQITPPHTRLTSRPLRPCPMW